VKQSAHIVSPPRVAEEFKKIVDAGATQYMLVNVSELREFVMEARMLADICWDAKTALAGDDPAKRFVDWWCREYFGDKAAGDASAAYFAYYRAFDSYDKPWFGSDRVHAALARLQRQLRDRTPITSPTDEIEKDRSRLGELRPFFNSMAKARPLMNRDQRRFFFEHCALTALLDSLNTQAAFALDAGGTDALKRADYAFALTGRSELFILQAEHPPFEHWYRETWIRRGPKSWNLHRPYEEVRQFLATNGKSFEQPDPEPPHHRATTTTAPASR